MNIHIADILLTGSRHISRSNYYDIWSDTFEVYAA